MRPNVLSAAIYLALRVAPWGLDAMEADQAAHA